jgi:hypothetical protein
VQSCKRGDTGEEGTFLISCAFGMQSGRLNDTGNREMFVEKFEKKPLNFQDDKGPCDIIIPKKIKKNVFLAYLFPSNLE